MKYVKIENKKKFITTNEFIIWLFVFVITLILFYNIKDALFKYILLGFLILLIIFGVNQLKREREKREIFTSLEKTDFLSSKIFKTKVLYFIWEIGFILIIYSLILFFFYAEFLANEILTSIIQGFALVFMIIGILLFIAGRFMKIEEGLKIQKYYKYFENIGVLLVISGIAVYSYGFVSLYPVFFHIMFYLTFISGSILLLLTSDDLKSVLFSIGIISIIIINLIFQPTLPEIYNVSFHNISIENIDLLVILDKISFISFILFFISSAFYLFYYRELSAKKYEKQKLIYQDLIITIFFVWIVSFTLLIIFT